MDIEDLKFENDNNNNNKNSKLEELMFGSNYKTNKFYHSPKKLNNLKEKETILNKKFDTNQLITQKRDRINQPLRSKDMRRISGE